MHPSTETGLVRGLTQRLAALDEERRTLAARRRLLIERHGRAVALGIALRHIRRARSQHQLLSAIEEVLVQHVGVEAFAVLDASTDPPRVLASRGLAGREDHRQPPLALVPLGAGEWSLGSLIVYRVMSRKERLDALDFELLEALGPQIAVALYAARAEAQRPTVRPPRTPRPEAP